MGRDPQTCYLTTDVQLTCENCREKFRSIFLILGVPFKKFDSANCSIHLSSSIGENKVLQIKRCLPEGTVLELKCQRVVERHSPPPSSTREIRRQPLTTARAEPRRGPAERASSEMRRPVVLPTAMCRNETEITYADADGYKQRLAVPAFRETEVAAATAATATAMAAQQAAWPPGCWNNYSLPGFSEILMNDENPNACSLM